MSMMNSYSNENSFLIGFLFQREEEHKKKGSSFVSFIRFNGTWCD